ncbi:MAG: DNA-directed RNA polymerase subunit beta [Proteobacteria bacterium]|nr:DNA-directed RNA polymerase subunit beta [Pseudomonadota bacterium]
MATSLLANNARFRRTFEKVEKVIDIHNLIEIQKKSYGNFLQSDIDPGKRENRGLQAVFNSVFPIEDFNQTASLQFVSYTFEKPKYEVDECRQRGMTYAAPLKVTVRLVVWDVDEETESQNIRDIKEQEVYFGELPIMTENGTFIVNGTERVVVSQLHRSPGVFFDSKYKTTYSGKVIFSARIIPNRGSWVDFEFDTKDLLYVRIDRRRKLPATVLLRALGYGTEEILNYFYNTEHVYVGADGLSKDFNPSLLLGSKAQAPITGPDGTVFVKEGKKVTRSAIKKMKAAGIDRIPVLDEEITGTEDPNGAMIAAHDIVDLGTGEVIVETNESIAEEWLAQIRERGIDEFDVLFIDNVNVGSFLRDTLLIDKIQSTEEAIIEIYRRLRPGDPPTYETALAFFENLFFNDERYDLSKVGRLKMNHKLELDVPLEQRTLSREDIMRTVRYLIELRNGNGEVDDIDHLGNRRVRPVGELLQNQFRIGLVRMEKAIKERMSLSEIETLMPHDLINAKPVSAVIKEFFGSSQLSQFMDQTNPLSEVTHKRRLSALGPGGLTRERAGFDVRDVHTTHYGRICPIETPEGPNIGLIASLATYARVNEYGFIETPYRLVREGMVTNEVKFHSALEEENQVVAQANRFLTGDGGFEEDRVSARNKGDFALIEPTEVQLMDISPNQLVSVATSLIPFLEHDDANRALMGSNMQRQAVPLVKTEAPFVGTGIERYVARDSGVTCVASRPGTVESVDATRIVVKTEDEGTEIGSEVDIYNLVKFRRSNQSTSINQKPIVRKGDHVNVGDVIADGPSTDTGELALGQNPIVAFMPWGGYNFEDSILISERMVREDVFTSIHIEEFEIASRDTKLGKEEITRDIPNVGEEALADLDESGIVRIGAEVVQGDILVGKITPKGETQLSPEEKLLRAIFGEKAGDVRDTSLRVPPGVTGTVIGAQIFSREGVERDERAKQIQNQEIASIMRDQDEEMRTIISSAERKLINLLSGHKAGAAIDDEDTGEVFLKKGDAFSADAVSSLPLSRWADISVSGGQDVEDSVFDLIEAVKEQLELVEMTFEGRIERLKQGDELPPGVIKLVKVYVAIKRKLSVGDKMAGRHGNKGVISKILSTEDMPYMPDGRPVDVVLNPLGVPSRMNVGQILETHLGWAAKGIQQQLGLLLEKNTSPKSLRAYLGAVYENSKNVVEFIDGASDDEIVAMAEKCHEVGIFFATPVFEGATEDEISRALELGGLPARGQVTLFDGRTGDAFDHQVTVGCMYMLKLHHLVDDKIHARSIGPYSLVTQQPLGGKAQFGGQRLGEMEVWAMEAYGAAYGLQEFLTVKSDDVVGRTRMYESIVKGENTLEAGLPESFNVLVKELQSLALDVTLMEDKAEPSLF